MLLLAFSITRHLRVGRAGFDLWRKLFRGFRVMLMWVGALNAISHDVAAQTLEVQEDVAAGLQLQRESWFGYLKWAWRWARILDTHVDMTRFKDAMTCKDALDNVYDQFVAKGIELDFLVDGAALEAGLNGKDFWERRIDLSALPKRVTLGKLLATMMEQLPGEDATVVLHNTFLEITTTRAAAGRDRSFHVLRRAATFAKCWLVIATICTLLFLLIRVPAVWRRTEGRLKGVAELMVRATLVFLFWPIWLAAVGVGLTRKSTS